MRAPIFRKIFAAMLAVAGLAFSPSSYADDWDDPGDDPGEDPGGGPSFGDPEYCDMYGHWWVLEDKIEPTCECEGCDLYRCTNCGDWDERNITPALGHNYVNGVCTRCDAGAVTYTFVPAVDPTCTTPGNVAYLLGSDNKWYDPTTTNQLYWIALNALGHSYGAWTTNTPPTCTTAGQKTRSCTRAGCTASETQAIAALGHSYGAWTTNTPPTCTTAGEETRACIRGDVSETRPLAALGHDWTAWTVVAPATYVASGEEARDCTRCDAHETHVLPMLQRSTFSIRNSGRMFTITRSSGTAAETVHYRTVGLSAYGGQHFTGTSGSLTFAPGVTNLSVTVTEQTPTADAYKFQTGASRYYRFEITDAGGFPLASSPTRDITTGTSVPSSGAFGVKNLTIQSAEYTADDRGYDNNGYKSVSSNGYFAAAAPRPYFQLVDAQLRMTLSMSAKENDDAYEYLQLLFNNTSACDNRSGCNNGNPGNISLSAYMAGFEMDTGSKDSTYRNYTFPVTNVGNNAGAANPWGHGTKYPLSMQKFNTATGSRASDGRIVVPLDFSSIVLRLNASGSSGGDEWAAKSVVAHVQAVDTAAPARLATAVAPGIRARGNEFYVSVAFSEPVTCSSATLTNSWGSLTYNSGSGSNVLTFKGTIPADATGALNITGWSGNIKDLAGNPLGATALTQKNLATIDASHAYDLAYDLAGGAAANLEAINGVISVSAGDAPDALAPKAASGITYSEGEATIFVPASAGRFVKAVIGVAAPAAEE